jgi:CRP-like cAMP-binding protein
MRDAKQISEFLTTVPLFYGLDRRQRDKLAKRFVPREYAAGQSIVTQGQGGEGMFIIVSGKAEVIRKRENGSEAAVGVFGPTDFFGELALLDDGVRTASVVAREETECLGLTRWDFIGILKEDADMGVAIAQEMAKRFRQALGMM